MASPILLRYQISLRHNAFKAIFAGAVVFGVACLLALKPPPPAPKPEYKATGTLVFSNPPPSTTQTAQTLQEQARGGVSDELLLADRVLETVAEKIDVKPEKLFRSVKINRGEGGGEKGSKGGGSGAAAPIEVIYTDGDPQRAQAAINLLLQEMTAQSRLVNTSRLRAQIEALKQRAQVAQDELTVAERQFYDFMSREGSSLVALQDGSLIAGITASAQQQRELQLQIDGVSGQIRSLGEQLGLTPAQAHVAAALSADPIIANIRVQLMQSETQLELLGTQLRPEHPTMAELLRSKTAYEQLLVERANEVIGDDNVFQARPSAIRRESSLDPTRQQLASRMVELKAQQDALLEQMTTLRNTEQGLRRDYETSPTKQLEKARLQQELQLKQTFFNQIQGALVDAESAEAETVGSLTVAQPPIVTDVTPEAQEPPNPIILIVAGFVGGIVVANAALLVLGLLDPHAYAAAELQSVFAERDVPVLGELPALEPAALEGELPILLGANAGYLSAYELLRSNLRRFAPKTLRVLQVVSVDPEEGKSTVAYNLAIASAQAGKRTLLIEADLRAPSHAYSCRLAVDPDAKAEPLSYYSSHNDCIRLVPEVANLYLVPSPGPQHKAAAILESSELKRLLDDARQRFDFVVVDTPALSVYNDAFLLQPLTDGMVIVARLGVTLKPSLGTVLDQMTEAEMPLLGGVINDVVMPRPAGAEPTIAPSPSLPGQPAPALGAPEPPPQLVGRKGRDRNGRNGRNGRPEQPPTATGRPTSGVAARS